MLQVNPEKRPSASDFLDLPIFIYRRQQKFISEAYEHLKKKEVFLKEKEEALLERVEKLRALKREKNRKKENTNTINYDHPIFENLSITMKKERWMPTECVGFD